MARLALAIVMMARATLLLLISRKNPHQVFLHFKCTIPLLPFQLPMFTSGWSIYKKLAVSVIMLLW
ncbi:MAG: hypothetical protein JXM69_03950 [Anaerolineae bacterium]|nr:hypothetical protein [Anaerolineae bacterium]